MQNKPNQAALFYFRQKQNHLGYNKNSMKKGHMKGHVDENI